MMEEISLANWWCVSTSTAPVHCPFPPCGSLLYCLLEHWPWVMGQVICRGQIFLSEQPKSDELFPNVIVILLFCVHLLKGMNVQTDLWKNCSATLCVVVISFGSWLWTLHKRHNYVMWCGFSKTWYMPESGADIHISNYVHIVPSTSLWCSRWKQVSYT